MQNEMNQGDKTKTLFLNSVAKWIACEQALRGTLAGGKGKACNYVSGIWDRLPPLSQGIDDRHPPPLSEGMDPPLL